MKGKRILTMLLSVLMVLQLLPSIALAAVVSESAAYSVVTELPAGRPGAPENSILAINNFNVAGGKISFELDIVATLSTGAGSDGSTIDAVVMSAADYTGSNHGNSPIKINNTNFNSSTLLQVSATYWRSGTATVTSGKASFASLGANLPLRSMKTDNISGNMITDNDCYYDDYVLILFNAGVGAAAEGRYVVKKFQVDSQGNLKADSYMVRYVKNTASIGTTAAVGGTVDPQITKPSTATTTLSPKVYTRTGYTFMGWDDDAQFLQKKGTGTVSATGTGTDYVNSLATMSDADAKNGMDHPVGGANNTIPAQTKDSIYNLYAQWKPIKVNLTPVTNSGGLETKPHSEKYDATQAKVNKPFSWEFNVAGANGTTKGVIIETAQEVQPGTNTPITGTETIKIGNQNSTITNGAMTSAQFLAKYGLGLASASSGNVTSAGGVNLTSGTGGKVYLTGTPRVPTTNDLLVTVRVWDKTNFSYDTKVLRIQGIAKGAQPVPTKDANTGLQSQVVESEGTKDGQIYGFYSAGPVKDADGMTTGYWNSHTDGTGTMTGYYITNRMIYRYRPTVVDGVPVDYTGLPNDGWREVPLPSNWYPQGNTNVHYADLVKSFEKNATTVIETVYDTSQNSYAPVKVKTAAELPAGFTGWPDSYGWIAYEGTLPVVHGLKENDMYEVQFRENSSYGESESQPITIGGAVASSGEEPGGAGGLAVNLSGGDEPKDDAKTVYDKFVSDAAALKPGDTLAIPDFTPTRENYSFAGWTLGERDENGQLILYRAGDTGGGEEPPAPETVTVIWLNDDGTEITRATFPGGTTEYPFPETATAPSKEGHTLSWSAPVTNDDGSITITAEYTADEPEARDGEGAEPTPGRTVTVTWVDPLKDGEDKTVKTAEGVELTPEGDLPDTVTHPEPPTHEGKTFEKWEKAVDAETGNVTYTAVYKDAEPAPPPTQTVRDTVTMPQTGPASLAAVWNATPEGFIALTLFDWDGQMIGTKVIAKAADRAGQEQLVSTAFSEIQTQYADVFTSHKGYDFGCWIPYSSATPTAYGVRAQSGNVNNMAVDDPTASDMTRQLGEPVDKVQPSMVTGDMQLKAAYVADSETLAVADTTARRYTVTPVNYDRYGTAGVVSITVRVTRQNESGQPVPRATSPALRVAMTAGGVTTYSLFTLSGADVEDVEIVPFGTPTGGVTQIVWSVIDTYGVVDWTGGAGSRLNGVTSTYTKGNPVTERLDNSNRQVLKKGERQYLYECYLGWINSLCEQQAPNDTSYASLSTINAAQLRAIGISTTSAAGTTVSAANIRKQIYEAWYAKNYTGGNRNDTLVDLTKREITDAIGSTANSIFSEGE